MNPTDVVRNYWSRINERDWQGLRDLLSSDVVVEWTASNERFIGPDNVVAVNAEYPEGWSIRVRSVIAETDTVASDVEVPMEGVGTFRVAAFTQVLDGKVRASTEYWIGVGSEEPPLWRKTYAQPADGTGLLDRLQPGA